MKPPPKIWDTERYGPFPVLHPDARPDGFSNPSRFCTPENLLGEIRTEEGQRLNWQYRCRFMPTSGEDYGESHLAKTPMYGIRWAIREYTDPGDIVLDPFMGSGTTGVEAMLQGRLTLGAELEFTKTTRQHLANFGDDGLHWELFEGDAEEWLLSVPDESVHLINFSNPYPDGKDHSTIRGSRVIPDGAEIIHTASGPGVRKHLEYRRDDNLGLQKGAAYWGKMERIQTASCEKLVIGGHAVFVIKDLLQDKQVVALHEQLGDLLPPWMEFQGTVLLEHYPGTLHMNTYEKRWGVRPPKEQVCPVFKRVG